jgi:hypothetical protein
MPENSGTERQWSLSDKSISLTADDAQRRMWSTMTCWHVLSVAVSLGDMMCSPPGVLLDAGNGV